MRKWIEIVQGWLFEATIPDTTYGYWIKPDGTALAVPFWGHTSVLRDYGYREYDPAMEDGWVRVVSENEGVLDIDIGKGVVTDKAIRTILAMMKKFAIQRVNMEMYEPDHPVILKTGEEVLDYLLTNRDPVRMERLAQSSVQ